MDKAPVGSWGERASGSEWGMARPLVRDGGPSMLELELKVFEQHREEWVSKHPGRELLVKGTELLGAFSTIEEALAEGARRFGLTGFLVRSTDEPRREVSIPALSSGVLRADPSHTVQLRRITRRVTGRSRTPECRPTGRGALRSGAGLTALAHGIGSRRARPGSAGGAIRACADRYWGLQHVH